MISRTSAAATRSLPLALLFCLLSGSAASAVEHEVRILLDLDDDAATGCLVTTVAGPLDGVDQVLITTVETSSPPPAGVVTDVATSDCVDEVADTFSPPVSIDGGWPAGIGNGTGGSDVVETYFPLVASVVSDPSVVRLGVVVTDDVGNEQALLTTDGTPGGDPIRLFLGALIDPADIPTVGEWGLLLLALLLAAASLWLLGRRGSIAVVLVLALAGAGVAWAAITLDGQTDDWDAGDQLATNGITLFGTENGDNLCFRVDVDLIFNNAPVAVDDAFTTPEDTQLAGDVTADNGSGADSDPNGDPLSVDPTPVSGPSDGTLVLGTDGTFTYDPDPDFNGTDSFVYRLTDGAGGEDTATVTITVDPVNDGPSADAVAETTPEDTPVTIELSGSDPEGDPLTFAIATGPTSGGLGAITSTGPTTAEVTYTPNADFTGGDSFTYTASDGTDTSAAALAEITVTPENDPPIADDGAGSTTEDVAVTFVLTGSDVDGDDLTFSIVTGPSDGSLGAVVQTGLTTAEVEYTPDPDFNGPDSFTFRVNDGTVDSAAATFDITVDPDQDAPVANDSGETTLEDTAVVITLTGSDPDGDPLTFAIDTGPTDGALGAITPVDATSATVTYTPDPDFNGSDGFTFTVNDGTDTSGPATVAIDVTPVNDAPSFALPGAPDQTVAEDSGPQTVNGFATSISPGPADEAGQAVTFTVTNDANALFAAQPAIDAGGNLTYTPAADANGTATVSVVAVDDGGTADGGVDTSPAQTFDITITAVDDPPTANDDTATVAEDSGATPIDVLANDTDPDGGPKLVTGTTDPAGGTVVITGGGTGLTYQPDPNFCNDGVPTDDFQYTITGGDSATVSVTVTCVNDPPVADDETFTAACNLEHVVEASAGESAAGSAPIFRTIADNVLAGDSDPVEGSAIAIVSASGAPGGTTDSTGPTFDITTDQGGSVTLHSDGSFVYTPEGGDRSVADSFTYTIQDADGGQDVGTVNLNVGAVCVWFVDNAANPTDGDGDGTSSDPFSSLVDELAPDALPDDAEDASLANDVIYVFEGNSTSGDPYQGDFAPDDGQKLLGQGVDLVVDLGGGPETLFTGNPANRPLIDDTDGDAVTVTAGTGSDRTGVEIRGFRLGGADDGVEVTSTGSGAVGVLISDNFFEDAGGEAVDANPGSTAAFDLTVEDNGYATASATGNGVDVLSTGGGTVTVAIDGNTNITSSAGAGIHVEKAGAGDVFVTSFAGNSVHGNNAGVGIRVIGAVFDADTGAAGFQQVAGGDTSVGESGNGVGGSAMVLTNVSGDLAFGDLDLYTDGVGGLGLDVTGSGVFNGPGGFGFRLASTSGTVEATAGPAVDLDPFTAGLIFDSVSSAASPPGVPGIRLHDLAGSFTATGGTLAGHTAPAVEVTGTNPGDSTIAVNLSGMTINHAAGLAPAIRGQNSAGAFNLIGSNITKGGGRVVDFDDMDGGSDFTGTTVTGTGHHGKRVIESAGTHNLLPVVITTPPPAAVDALHLENNSGTFNVPRLDVVTNGSRGLFASSGGTVNLTGATNHVTTTGHSGVEMSNTTIGASGITFNSITANTTGTNEGIDLDGVGGGAFEVTGTTTVNGTGGSNAGIDIATSGASFTFASIDVDSTGGEGVKLTNNGGTVSINGGDITGAAGVAFDLHQGSANVTYAGSINNTAGRTAEITSRTGGTVTLSGNLDHASTAVGIHLDSNSGGTTVFSGATKTIDSGASHAVQMLSNGGHTIRFTNGGLDLDTTSGEGFHATGGGTVEVSGAGNTVDTGTGRGVNIANTGIDALGVTFQRVSVNGAPNGILLDTTGTAGGFTVTGDGATGAGTSANNDSGGTIQNTTGDGVQLTNVTNVSLDQMRIQNAADHGIDGSGVTDLTLTRTNLVSNGTVNQEHGLNLLNPAGTITVTNVLGDGNFDAHLRVFSQTGNNLTLFTVDDSVFQNVTTGFFEDGISFEAQTGVNTAISVTNSTFANHDGDHIQASSNGSAVMDVTITGNTMTGAAGNLGAGITVNSAGNFNGTTTFDVSSNNIQKLNDNSASININVGTSTAAGSYSGTIAGNSVGTMGNADSAGDTGIAVEVNQNATMTVSITGNIVREFDNFGIDVGAVDGTGTVNATVTGNLVTSSDSNAFAAVFVDSQTNNVTCVDIGGAGALENTLSASAGFTDVAFQTGGSGVVNLESYGGAANNQGQIQTYIQGRNTGAPGVQLNVGGGNVQGGGACPTP